MPSLTSNFPLKKLSQIKMVLTTNTRTNLAGFAYKGIPTYPLIHKDKKNEKFAEAYSKAIKELEKDGTLAKLSKKYFGEDVFSYVDKEK